jgi:PelA/Pel-15E family pectate lyase
MTRPATVCATICAIALLLLVPARPIAAQNQYANPADGAARIPADGARGVSLINARLQWPASPDATSYNIYLGTSDPPPLRGDQHPTTLETGPLETATTYYWRVDAVTASGTRQGPVWSFMTAGTIRIVLVGDSTVTDDGGWGRGFLARVTSHVVLANQAKNGRSSKSYIAEGLWRDALTEPADVVLIQFGHNDQPGKGPDRETDPATTYRDHVTRFVDEARAAGAIPVIVTSLSRRSYDSNELVVSDQLVPYVEAARAVAAAKQVPIVDLYAASVSLLNQAGPNIGDSYGIVQRDGTLDRTHLSPKGSAVFGNIVADELLRVLPILTPYFRPVPDQAARQAAPAGPRKPISWNRALEQDEAWYRSTDATAVADIVLLYQRAVGGWPTNIDMARPIEGAERDAVLAARTLNDATIDNGATTTQLRFLARVFSATGQARFRDAFLRSFDDLLAAQYPNGGWPQYYPLRKDYSRHITFNDNAMVNVLRVMDDASRGRGDMAFVDAARRTRATKAVEKGIDLILKSQIRVGGMLTGWCAQVDEKTLEPRKARMYEHPSISGSESVGIVRFLMSLPKPSAQVVAAVEGAIAWFRSAKIEGVKVVQTSDPALPGGVDRVVVSDPAAPPIWARFYEIGTNRPIYSGRDSVVRYSLAEIELERRVNYSWLGPYAADLLARDYPAWRASLGPGLK